MSIGCNWIGVDRLEQLQSWPPVMISRQVSVKRRNDCSQSELDNLTIQNAGHKPSLLSGHSVLCVGSEEAQAVNDGAHRVKNCRIGLVDDDESVLRATKRLLAAEGWKVEAFSEPKLFLDHARTHAFGVVVLDILMPVMSGLEVQSRLHDISPSTRVIILTSIDDPAVLSRAVDGGALAVLRKPVNDEDFLKQIEAAAVNGTHPG